MYWQSKMIIFYDFRNVKAILSINCGSSLITYPPQKSMCLWLFFPISTVFPQLMSENTVSKHEPEFFFWISEIFAHIWWCYFFFISCINQYVLRCFKIEGIIAYFGICLIESLDYLKGIQLEWVTFCSLFFPCVSQAQTYILLSSH